MTEAQFLQLFIYFVLKDKDKMFLSNPLNTKLHGEFEAFKIGLTMGGDL